ncbi:MAG: hypothetical protein J3K34DRAFT_456079 [Monoraphidium minutum]|nr:MAG: hypothetical protein J3K34DRAFT_456079 [Monoraphidium minutum]
MPGSPAMLAGDHGAADLGLLAPPSPSWSCQSDDGDVFLLDAPAAPAAASIAPHQQGCASVADLVALSLLDAPPSLSVSCTGPGRMGWPQPSLELFSRMNVGGPACGAGAACGRTRKRAADAAASPQPCRTPLAHASLSAAAAATAACPGAVAACPATVAAPRWQRPQALLIPKPDSSEPADACNTRQKPDQAYSLKHECWLSTTAPCSPPVACAPTPSVASARRCLLDTPGFSTGCGPAPATPSSPRSRAASVSGFLARMEAAATCSARSHSAALDVLPPPAFMLLRGLGCHAADAAAMCP